MVELARLESVYTGNRIEGSNPSLSAETARKGARVVESTGLENRRGRKAIEGSNPSPSAKHLIQMTHRDGSPEAVGGRL